jgi:hypothetical protein
MLPAANHPIWTKIVTGKRPVQSEKLAINLFVKNNKLSFEKDASPAHVQQLAASTHAFFTQYEKIFAAEIVKIFA